MKRNLSRFVVREKNWGEPADRFVEPGVALDAQLRKQERSAEPFRRRNPRTGTIATVHFAPRPCFCAECGGRDFWQLPNGRYMCSRCQPVRRRVAVETEMNNAKKTL